MTAPRIYLDANATTAPLDVVVAETLRIMTSGAANPASAHSAGADARRLVERARDVVCDICLGAEPENVIFVSGGTEANNMVLRPFVADPKIEFLVAPVEHASILTPLADADVAGRVRWMNVDSSGRVDPTEVGRRAAGIAGSIVLAIQAANSETGVIQPIAEIVRALRSERPDAFVLLDAAQAVGRIPIDIDVLDVDAVSFSAHKLHGPAGVGTLILRDPDARPLPPLLLGGGQENGRRSGTLNVAGIAGFAAALTARRDSFAETVATLASLRDAFEQRLTDRLGDGIAFNGRAADRVANTSNVRFAGADGMRLLALLDSKSVMASQGSACSSGRPEPSATLLAMGLTPKDAFASLRFSFSILNTMDEAIGAAETAASLVQEIVA